MGGLILVPIVLGFLLLVFIVVVGVVKDTWPVVPLTLAIVLVKWWLESRAKTKNGGSYAEDTDKP
jgi:urea transporter